MLTHPRFPVYVLIGTWSTPAKVGTIAFAGAAENIQAIELVYGDLSASDSPVALVTTAIISPDAPSVMTFEEFRRRVHDVPSDANVLESLVDIVVDGKQLSSVGAHWNHWWFTSFGLSSSGVRVAVLARHWKPDKLVVKSVASLQGWAIGVV